MSYPAIINKLFQPPSSGPVAQRLDIWNKGYEAGKASIPLTAIGAAVCYVVGAYKFPLIGKLSQQAAIGAGVLHLGIIPFTVSFTPGCPCPVSTSDLEDPTVRTSLTPLRSTPSCYSSNPSTTSSSPTANAPNPSLPKKGLPSGIPVPKSKSTVCWTDGYSCTIVGSS